MVAREGMRPDSRRRAGIESLEFQGLPALRPGPPAGYRLGWWRGFAMGWAVSWIGAFLALAILGFGR